MGDRLVLQLCDNVLLQRAVVYGVEFFAKFRPYLDFRGRPGAETRGLVLGNDTALYRTHDPDRHYLNSNQVCDLSSAHNHWDHFYHHKA